MKQITIGVDLDGVINDFANAFNVIYNKYYPGYPTRTAYKYSWFYHYYYKPGIDPQKWMEQTKAETWHVSKPYPGAIKRLKELYAWCKINGYIMNIITVQPWLTAQRESLKWLKNYGVKYDEIYFPEDSRDKWDYVDIMIDDSPTVINAKPPEKVSIKVEQRWNGGTTGDLNIEDFSELNKLIIIKAINIFNKRNNE